MKFHLHTNRLMVLVLCTFMLLAGMPRAAATNGKLAAPKDTTQVKIKRGWTLGALPSVGYNTDIGFQYGALAELFDYGDGSTFPQYRHMMHIEAAYTTKRTGLFRFFYDSAFLIPKTRMTLDLTYIPEQMSDFYGFNGFESVFNSGWGKTDASDYHTRAFYRMKKNFFRATLDFQGTLVGHLSWNAGLGFFNYKTDQVDVDYLNRNKSDEKKLPSLAQEPTLYNYYKQWGLIKPNEANGGSHLFLRAGLTYDSRNHPNNPTRGIWADAFATYVAAFGDMKDYNTVLANASFRHYVPLWSNRFVFAYRLSYQGTVSGGLPFYMKNFMSTLFTKRANYMLLGGENSLRGILRNRITADGYAFANIELRMKLASFTIARQAFYVGLNPLFDIGLITDYMDWAKSETELRALTTAQGLNYNDFFAPDQDGLHMGAGLGLKIAMNENFILSVEWAKSLNKQDGNNGVYVLLGYMF